MTIKGKDMIRQIINKLDESKSRIYRNDDWKNWSEDDDGFRYAKKMTNQICGLGMLEIHFKSRKDNPYTFMYLGKGERGKGKDFEAENKNKGEKLVRYASRVTVAGGMMPLCVLNADKGYMRIMENIDEDPEIQDAQWSKPMKFNYLRVVY